MIGFDDYTVILTYCSVISAVAGISLVLTGGNPYIAVYLLMGLIGVPVFANGTSGISVLLGPTGGYMIGWFFAGWVMGMIEKWLGRDIRVQALAMLCGLIVFYLFGTAWFMAVYAVT